jgi:hypothetical protein
VRSLRARIATLSLLLPLFACEGTDPNAGTAEPGGAGAGGDAPEPWDGVLPEPPPMRRPEQVPLTLETLDAFIDFAGDRGPRVRLFGSGAGPGGQGRGGSEASEHGRGKGPGQGAPTQPRASEHPRAGGIVRKRSALQGSASHVEEHDVNPRDACAHSRAAWAHRNSRK